MAPRSDLSSDSAVVEAPVPHFDVEEIPEIVARLRGSFDAGRTRPLEWRRRQLEALLAFVRENSARLVEALRADLGKPEIEARTADLGQISGEVKLALKSLKKWTQPEGAGWNPLLGRSFVVREPLGVVLIIAPWNYPVGLLLSPLVGALAAGNAAVLKPSEVTAHTSAALAELLPRYLDSDAVALVEGGVTETTALLDERFDHIFYTGNGTVGRIVMQAAARNLTPVTLELGGKSPCIVDRTAELAVTARRIAWGKFLNAGQTCVAPDYVLAHRDVQEPLVDALKQAVDEFYRGDAIGSGDYARIVAPRHLERLSKLLDGQRVAFGGGVDAERCSLEPTVVRDVPADAPLMRDEIFGPILPVNAVADVGEAIDVVRRGEKPLALYVFTQDPQVESRVLAETSSGGVCVNGTILHIGNPAMPFGGVGESGMGAYHGRFSFETFSHRKAVLKRSFRLDLKLTYPPYTERKLSFIKKMF